MAANTSIDKDRSIREIIDRISSGESLRFILYPNRAEHLPSISTFLLWISEDKALSEQYARAMEMRAAIIFEEMFEIADDASNDFMTIQKGDVSYEVENKEVVSRSRLRIDTRKWALSRMNPKKYGERIQLAETDTIGNDKPKIEEAKLKEILDYINGKPD